MPFKNGNPGCPCCSSPDDVPVCGCTLSKASGYTLTASGGASWTLNLTWYDTYDIVPPGGPGTGPDVLGPGWYGCRVTSKVLPVVTTPPNVCFGQAVFDTPTLFKLSANACQLVRYDFEGRIVCIGGACAVNPGDVLSCADVAPGTTWCAVGTTFSLTRNSCSPLDLVNTTGGITYSISL